MYTRQYIQRKTPSNSSSTPAHTSLFRQRPFNDEANQAVVPPQQEETPDLQTQLERAARFGHNFGQVKVQDSRPAVIQPKLAIGAPGDKYEQEADSVAAQVMSMAAHGNQQPIQRDMTPEQEDKSVQTKPLASSISPLIQREAAPEEEQDQLQAKPLAGLTIQREAAPEEEQQPEQVQAKPSPQRSAASSNDASDNLENQLTSSKGGGSALPDNVRAFMEPRFGVDFSSVRVHTDSQAVQMNQAVGAQAFTHGNDIYFGAGKSPGISDLTAHELTHVVQQTGAVQRQLPSDTTLQSKPTVSSTPDGSKIQRDGGATAAAAGLALAGLGLVQNQVNQNADGLSYSSDQVTYPKDLQRVGETSPVNKPIARFRSYGAFSDNVTDFNLYGDFSKSYEKANETNRTMANVYIDMADTTSYYSSRLTFQAKALQTPYGTPENPKIRFVCTGRFDPAGIGDCNYRVVLEIDQHGNAYCIEQNITSGKGDLSTLGGSGFLLMV